MRAFGWAAAALLLVIGLWWGLSAWRAKPPPREQPQTPAFRLAPAIELNYFNRQEMDNLGFSPDTFDLEKVRYLPALELSQLISGGPLPDKIDSIDTPRWVTVAETDAWLDEDAAVMGIQFDGITRAYPLAILNWHEIVNDRFGQTPVVVTYCPLCNSGVAFLAPELDAQLAVFGTSGRLYRSDLVMYDRVTGTFWSQMEGRPIVGPMVGEFERLDRLPVDIVSFRTWKTQHPDTQVLGRPHRGDRLGNRIVPGSPRQLVRDYLQDPYARYRRSNPQVGQTTQFGVPFTDGRLSAKADVIGILVGDQAKAYSRKGLLAQGIYNDTVGGVPLLVFVAADGTVRFFERTFPGTDKALVFSRSNNQLVDQDGHPWDEAGRALAGPHQGIQLTQRWGTPSFWFAWVSFNPETDLFVSSD